MQSKIIVSILAIFVLISNLFAVTVDEKTAIKQRIQFLKMSYQSYPFMKGFDYKNNQETVGRYFTDPIYRKLQGNDLMGFLYNPGFSFAGSAISLKEVKTVVGMEKYRQYFINSLGEVAREVGMEVKKDAICELGVCVVNVIDVVSSESLAGVVLELYVKNRNTGKSIFMRIKAGAKTGWYDGMKIAWRYIYLIMKSTEKKNG